MGRICTPGRQPPPPPTGGPGPARPPSWEPAHTVALWVLLWFLSRVAFGLCGHICVSWRPALHAGISHVQSSDTGLCSTCCCPLKPRQSSAWHPRHPAPQLRAPSVLVSRGSCGEGPARGRGQVPGRWPRSPGPCASPPPPLRAPCPHSRARMICVAPHVAGSQPAADTWPGGAGGLLVT